MHLRANAGALRRRLHIRYGTRAVEGMLPPKSEHPMWLHLRSITSYAHHHRRTCHISTRGKGVVFVRVREQVMLVRACKHVMLVVGAR
jgi:hypothetical protein